MTTTDGDRRHAVEIDYLLYDMWKAGGLTLRAFVAANPRVIDERARELNSEADPVGGSEETDTALT